MDFLMVQLINFITAIGIGFIIGILFDVYRGLWKKCTPSSKTMPLWDIFWWLLVTSLVFLILLNLNWGELRLYLLLGQIIGFVFYLKRISRYFLKNFILFLHCAEKIIKKIIMIIVIPFRVIKKIVVFPFKIVRLVFRRSKVILKKSVWVIGLVLRAIPRKCKKILKKLFKRSRNKK
ncbi:MAG: spore cortex biosynthesis protein YabQ [Dehalobacterium sp.]